MLAGLQSASETLFPKLRMTPDPKELQDGEDRRVAGKIVRLSGYETRIFDMHDSKSRKAYSALMLDLSVRQQTRQVHILVNDRQVMTRKDGTTGWFRYIEWMEYDWDRDGRCTSSGESREDGKEEQV